MKKEYESPAIELVDMELANMVAATTEETIDLSTETTTTVDSRQLLIFSLTDD